MSNIRLFESKKIRSVWNEDEEKWYFSIVDVVGSLTDSPNPNNYWKVLKHRLAKEGNESVTNCNQLKMQSADGKFYKTDVGDTEQLLRLIQSIPSPKAEPFKQWLAKVGYERIEETEDPELSFSFRCWCSRPGVTNINYKSGIHVILSLARCWCSRDLKHQHRNESRSWRMQIHKNGINSCGSVISVSIRNPLQKS